jgi:hypothetical protein
MADALANWPERAQAMGRGMLLIVGGLAVAAVAGCSGAGMHTSDSGSPRADSRQVVAEPEAPPRADQVRLAGPAGQATFRQWWVSGGHRRYQDVASDLSQLIITDVLRDQDETFTADAGRLVADATAASRHLPPVDTARWRAGMTELARAGREALDGSYAAAYLDVRAALPELAAFNRAVSGWVATAPSS